MTTQFDQVDAWAEVPIGEDVVATAIRDPDHASIFTDLAQVWNANAGMMDVGLYTFDRRGVALTYEVVQQNPVAFRDTGVRVRNTLVERAMLKMPRQPAAAMAEAVLEAVKQVDPELFEATILRLTVK